MLLFQTIITFLHEHLFERKIVECSSTTSLLLFISISVSIPADLIALSSRDLPIAHQLTPIRVI